MIKQFICLAAALMLTTSCAVTHADDMSGQTLSPSMSVDQILDAADQAGQNLKDFDANITLKSEDPVTGDKEKYVGHLWFQDRGDDNVRMHVLFDKIIVGNQIKNKQMKEYLLSDGWLTTRNYTKDGGDQNRTQVIKPGQKVNLLKLGEGPFPLPIGQKKQDVLAQFNVTKVAPTNDDPADTVHLKLIPKKDSSLDRKFKTLDFWLDDKTHMPARIETLDKSGSTDQTTDFSDLHRNNGLKDSDFELPSTHGDWNKTES